MNNVTINSLNIISGSIICDDVETSQNCEIKDCIVSRGHHFGSDGGKKNKVGHWVHVFFYTKSKKKIVGKENQ